MDRNDLFKKLFKGCNGYIELRAIKEGGITKQCFIFLDGSWQSIGEEVDKFCEKYKNRNACLDIPVYFCHFWGVDI